MHANFNEECAESDRAASELGADGIVVSNHGGRHLDGVLSSIRWATGVSDQ
jgi:L-lactate dehydrogenase (cytochrome)